MSDFFLHALVTLFVTIDPVALAPIYAVLMDRQTRRLTAIRASAIAAAVLVGFALVGEQLIGFLGISMPAFRTAGGILLFWIAFEMVFGLREPRKSVAAQAAADDDARDIAAFPLAVPLIAGPGAISAAILEAARAPGAVAMLVLIGTILGLIAVCLAIFLLADETERALGKTGRLVVSRLLGILLAALAVQFVADGVIAFVKTAGAS